MNSRRLLIALLLALVLSGAVTFFVSRKLSGRVASHSNIQRYVAASHALQAGDVLKPEDLVLVDWPTSIELSKPFSKVADPGRPGGDLSAGRLRSPFSRTIWPRPGSGIGLTTKIPEGMRATSVKSDEIVGVAGFLFPGSHVDVLVTLRSDGLAAPATQIVLQDVEVLTVGQKLEPDPQGKPDTVSVVTLLLTPEDSQKLVLAASQGSIQFVLRNGADHTRSTPCRCRSRSLSGAARRCDAHRITPRRYSADETNGRSRNHLGRQALDQEL